jgi:UDP-GlcNAc:undecaprenyl-phosphate/decaprenyl-phosphate GlcNAc-1-phosphate transferase
MDKAVFLHYILPFISAFFVGIILTLLIKAIAEKFKIIDYPVKDRKIHTRPTPLLGGLAIYLAIFLLIFIFKDFILDGRLQYKSILALLVGGGFLMIGGFLDDKFDIKPGWQFIWPFLASLSLIFGGIEVKYITNPTGGIINITNSLISGLIVFIWVLGMIYTTKFLDGLDGLVSGVTFIGSIILFCVSLFWDINQSGTSILCLLLAGSVLGFLFFNFYPARIFLGEGGSTFLGFFLGSLAIISGAKIATTLLIMGIPILDVAWVIIRRLFKEKHSAFMADKKHLHFRLLDIGFQQRSAVLFLYFLTLLFGSVAVFQKTTGKLIALVVLIVVMIVLAFWMIKRFNKIQKLKIKS